MVSSVTSIPYYSYLSQLQGTASTGGSSTTTAKASDTAKATSASLVSSLLSGGAYSTSVLSLLQQDSSGNFDPISTILGGSSTDNSITKLYAGLYTTSAASSLQTANLASSKPASASTTTGASSIQNLIDSATQSSIAYNQTIQQNAANLVTQSEANTSGITSLVS